ncbi:DUF4411 family protein [Shewanella sp.]|uniref:DUF4411 family protein n=1 Tax=Shewanella sp. TaxID=50422 RepID=UPI003A86EEF0
MKYLLDSNTFIEAKNRYYSMTICPGYWEWILSSNVLHGVASIEFVKDELVRGNDELAEWVKEHCRIFYAQDDAQTQAAFGVVVDCVMALESMRPGAKEEFLSGADPWLIAKAMVTGATIVTHEVFNNSIRKKVLIPNICKIFGVNCINTFELLHNLEAEFVMTVA